MENENLLVEYDLDDSVVRIVSVENEDTPYLTGYIEEILTGGFIAWRIEFGKPRVAQRLAKVINMLKVKD